MSLGEYCRTSWYNVSLDLILGFAVLTATVFTEFDTVDQRGSPLFEGFADPILTFNLLPSFEIEFHLK